MTGKRYWRSLDELADTPEFRAFLESEFPGHAAQMLAAPTRRRFLKLMGASIAMAGLAGCRRWPEEKLAPFAHRPEDRTPGVPEQYATAMELGGVATGVLVTSYDGRPIKIEGNPLHPGSLGAASAMHQASILEMYDPDRSRFILQKSGDKQKARSWDDFAAFARPRFDAFKKNGGKGLAVLSGATNSLSVADLRRRFMKAFPQAKWCEYEPISRDHEREGTKLAFGKPIRPQLDLSKAETIVCIGADILGRHPNALRHAADWAKTRRSADAAGERRMSRMYAVESTYSITGSVADHRLAMPAGQMPRLVHDLASLLVGQAATGDAAWQGVLNAIAGDLKAHRGRAVVIAGAALSAEVHAAVATINEAIGAGDAGILRYSEEPDADRPNHVDAIASLRHEMSFGIVETLVVLGGNPVYDAPADLEFATTLAKVPASIHLSLYNNETSRACTWHLPRAHYLEAWGDARAWDGTAGVVQPLIEPLYNGRSTIELLAWMLGEEPASGYDLVRRTWQAMLPEDDFEKAWRRVLHDGLLADSAYSAAAVKPQIADAVQVLSPVVGESGTGEEIELVFVADAKVHDGRFANSGWLQEMPDSITQMTWDNAALVSVGDAKKLGVTTGDMLRIRALDRDLKIPAYVLPGQVAGSIAVALGYGRQAAGQVGTGVGFDAYPLRTSRAMHVVPNIEVVKLPGKHTLACAQDHHAIDRLGFEERRQRATQLVREIPLPVYQQNPEAAQQMGETVMPLPLFAGPVSYDDHRWGMAIDLTSCIGCNACVVACQAENNIPIVGKEEVLVGREMQWIRIDRYFSGEPDEPSPDVAFQPMTCHHCENAPCEQVCPVAATVHDTEGLNTMVYNRCIGTRYCSNNCPYKVRRFNYFDYHSKGPHGGRTPWLGMPDTQQRSEIDMVRRMQFNPEVTVRMRGVMEKCTYCVQRIQVGKIKAKNERRTLQDGEIVPACAQTCPTRAIVFGDLNDPNSEVRRLQEHNRSYFILEELDVRPRTKYLARLRNPAESLAGRTEEAPSAEGPQA